MTRRIAKYAWLGWIALAIILSLTLTACTSRFDAPIGFQAGLRDAFPVFNNPELISVAEAKEWGQLRDDEPIIGVAFEGHAKAYPIDLMGVHELGNDVIGNIPIAVTW